MKTGFYPQPTTLENVQAMCPWAIKIKKIAGGYMMFESIIDFEKWQKEETERLQKRFNEIMATLE